MRYFEGFEEKGRVDPDDVFTVFLIDTFQIGPDDYDEMVVDEIDLVLDRNEHPDDYPTFESLPQFLRDDYLDVSRIQWGRPTLIGVPR